MKGFNLSRMLVTAAIVLVIVAVAARVAPLRKLVFNE